MPANLRYSAAKTSVIARKSINRSPAKGLKSFISSPAKSTKNTSKKDTPERHQEKLDVQDYNVELDYQLSRKHSVTDAIDTIIANQWTEGRLFRNKFYTEDEVRSRDMESLVFALPGLSMSVKAEIMKYRLGAMPSGLVTTNQLYSIFEQEGPTFVDKSIEVEIRKGNIRKFVISNASPVIARSHHKLQNGKISYGYENVEVLVRGQTYLDLISSLIRTQNNARHKESLTRFLDFVSKTPAELFVSPDERLSAEDLSALVSFGLVTLTSNHLNEIESQYAIAFPNCGTFLKAINAGRSWVVKTLGKSKWKELLEQDLFNKWEGIDFHGDSKMTNFRKPFYGFDLNWILADSLGAGILEVFNTPVGRGWKLTGKR